MPVNARYLIKPEVRADLKDHDWYKSQCANGVGLQKMLGFSDDTVMGFYEAACALLQNKRYQDSADAFFFLSHLAPQVKAFWLGQARSERLQQHPNEAIPLYMAALALDQGNEDLYLECVRCCLAANNVEAAHSVLDDAISYASAHTDDTGCKKLHDTCTQGKEWITRKYAKGGLN